MSESNTRSLAKAVSYRVLGSTGTVLVFFILSGNITLSLGAGAIDSLLKIALYFLHERMWNYIPYGRPKPPEYQN